MRHLLPAFALTVVVLTIPARADELPKPEVLEKAFDTLWTELDANYPYFAIKPQIDWDALRDEYRPLAVGARDRDDFLRVLTRMLANLRDLHVFVEDGDRLIGTAPRPWWRNWNGATVQGALRDLRSFGRFAIVGTTRADGFGYLAVTDLKASPEDVDALLAELDRRRDAPGFLVDLRPCSGGDEEIARRIAGFFCGRPVVYAKHRYRRGSGHDDFGPESRRVLEPSAEPYTRPVVGLIGLKTMSSAEAFALMLKALPDATLVGTATRGASGNPKPVELPDLNVRVWYSRWEAMDPEGNVFEDKGIAPDVLVDAPPEAYAQADPTFERGVEVLRAKVAKEK